MHSNPPTYMAKKYIIHGGGVEVGGGDKSMNSLPISHALALRVLSER